MPKLLGKNALITGASSGIGEAVAIRFGEEGANVAINYNSGADRAKAVKTKVHKIGAAVSPSYKAVTVQADVSSEEQVKRMFTEVLDSLGSIDILVNNSGIQKPVPSHELEMSDYDRILGVNLR